MGPDESERCVVADGSGGRYSGGDLSPVAGQARAHRSHMVPNGSVAPWSPVVNAPVKTMLIKWDILFSGEDLTNVNPAPQHDLIDVRLSLIHRNKVNLDQSYANDWCDPER